MENRLLCQFSCDGILLLRHILALPKLLHIYIHMYGHTYVCVHHVHVA